ncbi:hypothetical protein ACVXHA_12270 [Escherichia coli]
MPINAASWRLFHNGSVSTILDWAQQREMGFSYFIALGAIAPISC